MSRLLWHSPAAVVDLSGDHACLRSCRVGTDDSGDAGPGRGPGARRR